MTSFKRFSRGLTSILCVALTLLPAHGQPVLAPLQAQGQFRDAVVDPVHGRFFVTVYDRDALWALDPDTGRIATKINVGDGPAAAARDDQFMVVANRLDNSATVIRLADLSIAATVETGSGPAAVVALGDGRFAVANTFSDSLSVLDTRDGMKVTTIDVTAAVPVDLAVSGALLAIAGRAASELHLYALPALAPLPSVTLPEIVTRVEGLPGGDFVVASDTSLYRVDTTEARVVGSRAVDVSDMTVSGDTIHVISNGAHSTFDMNLAPRTTDPLDGDYSIVVAEGEALALLDPVAGRALAANLHTLPQQATVKPAPESAPTPAPITDTGEAVVVEARTVTPAEPAPVEAEAPAMETPEPESAPTPEVEPVDEPVRETAPAPETMATPMSAPTEAEPAPSAPGPAAEGDGASVRRNPIVTGSVRAPSLSRPSASPLHQLSRKTITDALVQPTEFGSTEGGFQAPDLTKDLENITFESASGAADSDTTVFTEFRAELGDLTLTAKNLEHSRTPVNVHARGDVLITQQTSSITADEIHFRMDEASEQPEGPKVLEGGTEDGPALDEGHLTLQKAHIIEPTREMTADYLDYDFKTGKGELENAKGQAGIYYFSAEKLHLHGPQTLTGENVWVTTCDRPHPHYKIRLSELELEDGQPTAGSDARLQLGKADTPLYLPRWRRGGVGGSPWNIDFDSGRQAEIGYYVNVGQQYEINPDVALGPRLFVTEKEGVGFGTDLAYDFMDNPASRFYRTRGDAHALYTTEDRGYVHWYHRYEYSNDLVVKAQVEHWGDQEFYREFYYDAFRNRSQPRSFVNVSYRQPSYIVTGTARPQTHGWFAETEQLPEATFHLLDRPIAENLYFSFDTANGYYNREPSGVDGGRTANTARLTYSWDPHPAIAITPYWEVEGNYYTRDRSDSGGTGSLATTFGVTSQTRLHRTYGGRWGFSAFKHVIVPSITYSYRPDTSVDPLDIPQYDPLDSIFGRSRIETKLANVFYGRDAESGEVWQVGRITLYQGNDLRNERRTTEDYEIEVDIRPRPWWGFQVVGERQVTSDEDSSLSEISIARNVPSLFAAANRLLGREESGDFSGRFGDYNRILSQFYYDGSPLGKKLSGRVGFAYTETRNQVFNREALYGLGYKFSDKWGVGFEHTYDFEDDDLRTQTYELRRSLHCWETAIRFRDRESGFDINFEFNIKAFPGSRIKL